MANHQHVAVVKKGREAIDEWRRMNPGKILNLSRADLREANLKGANLTAACAISTDLANANLSGANLSGANLSYASLRLADLSGANLVSAQLFNTNLIASNLSNADLSKANLEYANLELAELSHANLSESKLTGAVLLLLFISEGTVSFKQAVMRGTAILNCDMNDFEGLETVRHEGPSNIDINTLIMSYVVAGRRFTREIESFLLNAGVPKSLLNSLPEIVAGAEYCNSFVCYGEPDKVFAERLVKDLRAKGASCWIYSLDSTPGERTWGEITQRRREAEKMIVLCSAASLIRDGVKKEIEEQIDEEPDKIIPISLDNLWKEEGFAVKRGDRDLKPFLLERNYADFCDPAKYGASLDRLLKGLKKSGKPSRKSKK